MSTPIIAANLRHAARNHQTVTIGGGDFGPSELKQAAELIEAAASQGDWMPLTPELIIEIDAGRHGRWFWLATKIQIGQSPFPAEYEWQRGRNPHGFNSPTGNRWHASQISHVMPYNPPAQPKS